MIRASRLINFFLISGYIRPQFPFEPNTQLCGASEINASLTSHSPIKYQLKLIDMPSSYSYRNLIGKIKISTTYLDPRLVSHQHSIASAATPSSSSSTSSLIAIDRKNVDPRIRGKQQKQLKQKINPFSTDPSNAIKTSEWYQHLNMADKIQLNDRLTFAAFELMQYRQQLMSFNDNENQPQLDLNLIMQNPMFYQLYQDYNISVNEVGEFIRMPVNMAARGQEIVNPLHRIDNYECYYFQMGYQLHPNYAYGQTGINLNIQSGHNDANIMPNQCLNDMQYQVRPY